MWLYFLRRLSQKQWCCSSNSSRDRNRVLEGRGTHLAQLNEELVTPAWGGWRIGLQGWRTDSTLEQAVSPRVSGHGQGTLMKSPLIHLLQYFFLFFLFLFFFTSVFLKKGSSTIRMTHPGSLYTMHAYELSSRLGEIGSQGKRLRNPLTNYPGESVVLQRLRGRQEAHLCKMSTLRQWFLHHTYDTRSDAGSHSQQDKTYQTVFWIYGLILVANAYVGMHG